MTEGEYEQRTEELLGSVLNEVLYFEIDYPLTNGETSPRTYWNLDPRYDSLDFGLLLRTRNSGSHWIGWGSSFFQYGVEIEPHSPFDSSSMRSWNVTLNSRWRPLVGMEIVGVKTYWSWVEVNSSSSSISEGFAPGVTRVRYPQDLGITFNNGHNIYISACEIQEDDSPMGMADNITVIFDEVIAKHYKVGPHANY